MPAAPYTAAIVTFRRPSSLEAVLLGLQRQEHQPSLVVVADNDPAQSAEAVVRTFAETSGLVTVYVPMKENLGPAGGWAEAARRATVSDRRGAWLAVFDDDDPILHPHVMGRLAGSAASCPDDVAALGLRGARLHRRSMILRRVHSTAGGRPVDYLASGGAPLYRWSAIDDVGFFDEQLFFGFEDLDLGLRLRRRGWRLLVVPSADHVVQSTAAERSDWREYYKTRALVVICRRHLGPVALGATLVRSLVLAAPVLMVHGHATVLRARWQAVRDGLADRLGPGDHAPSTNPPKPPVDG
jgi:GT2 family glycosyltransferase